MYVPTSNSASHFYHEKNDSPVPMSMGLPIAACRVAVVLLIIFMLGREEDNVGVVSCSNVTAQ